MFCLGLFLGRPVAQGQGSGQVFPKAGALSRSIEQDGPAFYARSMGKTAMLYIPALHGPYTGAEEGLFLPGRDLVF